MAPAILARRTGVHGTPPLCGSPAPTRRPARPNSRPAARVNVTADAVVRPGDGVGLRGEEAGQHVDDDAGAQREAPVPFVWDKQWYPVAIESWLDKRKPFATKLLGKEVVVWWDGLREGPGRSPTPTSTSEGTWRAVRDLCPHRLAPLSEGRVEADGTLACSYHGWRFDGGGRPVCIPQAAHDGPAVDATARASPRACVAAYPTCTAFGYVWVWPDAGSGAEAAASRPPGPWQAADAAAAGVRLVTILKPSARDMPLPYEVQVENITDQSHVPFAHARVAWTDDGPTSDRVGEFTVSRVNQDMAADGRSDGYSFDLTWYAGGRVTTPVTQRISCLAPSYVEYFTPRGEFWTVLAMHVTPLDDVSCRFFVTSVATAPPTTGLVGRARAALAERTPAWVTHSLLMKVVDGDLAFLAPAARATAAALAEGRSWARAYFMPANADASVLAWRKWFHGRGGGGHTAAAGGVRAVPPALPKAAALDRFNQHTKHCPSCRAALSGSRAGAVVCLAAAAACFLAAAALLGRGARLASPGVVAAMLGVVAGLRGAAALRRFGRRFVYLGYDHWTGGPPQE